MIYKAGLKPKRATKGSCGYDLCLPYDVRLSRWKWTYIDLEVAMEKGDIKEGCFGWIVPRSSTGSKFGLRLRNTGGVIDHDYINRSIKAVIKTDHWIPKIFRKGDRILQLIIVPYDTIPGEDVPTEERKGGIGSTGTN